MHPTKSAEGQMNAGGEGSVGLDVVDVLPPVGLDVMGVLPPVGLLVAGTPPASPLVGNGVMGL